MKKILLAALLLTCAAPVLTVPAMAEPSLNIVATVNDEAITSSDLDGRMRLAMLGAGIQPTPEVVARLREQLLRTLIDERLQLQEAKRDNVTVEEAMIDKEIAALAQRNNQKPEQLPAFFARAGVPMSALRDQVRASIAWTLVVQRKLRPQVNITDRDIDAEVARMSAAAGQPEYLSAEIYLPVQKAGDDESVRQSAYRLIDQMSKGVRFSAIAREFSQAPSAARGGDMGWLRASQMDSELAAALTKLTPGTLSPPVRTAGGYYILMLRDQRMVQAPGATKVDPAQASYNLRQVILPLAADAPADQVQAASDKLEALRAKARSCSDVEQQALANGDTTKGDLGDVKVAEVPPALQPVLAGLKDSQPSPALRNARGVLYLMICGRTTPSAATPSNVDREEVANMLGTQKMELLARRLMRDLRTDSFIEIRG